MGAFVKLIDAILFVFFAIIAVAAPLIDAQVCLPADFFPDVLVDLELRYSRKLKHFLILEKPGFYVGLAWLQLLLQWPLSIANLYAISAGKSWFRTTCLVSGVSFFTSLVAILAELMRSHKASDELLTMYSPFVIFAVLAVLRGLLPHSGKTTAAGRRPGGLNRKKRV